MNSFIPKGKKSPADYTFFHGLKAPIGDEKDKNHVCTHIFMRNWSQNDLFLDPYF